MKKTIALLLFVIILPGCKKKESGGTILYKISYTNSNEISQAGFHNQSQQSPKSNSEVYYTQFGSYITSLTPQKFTAKFQTIRFRDEGELGKDGHSLELIDNNASPDDPKRIADFSNNNSISVTPILSGTTDNNGLFIDKNINFIYFYFLINYFYQELDLPVEYKTVNLNLLSKYLDKNGNIKTENTLKIQHFPLIESLFDINNGLPSLFVFGNTSSTSVYYPVNNNSNLPNGSPLRESGGLPVIWSSRYNSFILNPPLAGETKNISTTISFNTANLVQIYAGADNIPYTKDDVIVYAPNFWERISVNVIIK